MPSEDDIRRFMSYVKKTKTCWLWIGGKSGNGSGAFHDRQGRNLRAHRVMAEWTNGPIAEEIVVCHNCDVKLCVNPLHLFLGTRKDNCLDRVMPPPRPRYARTRVKKSMNSGETNGMAKLTIGKVLLIRAMHATGRFTQTEIGRRFKITSGTIHQIIRRELWAHI